MFIFRYFIPSYPLTGKVSCTSASLYTIIIMPTQFWMFTQLYKLRKISFIQCDHIKHQAINWAMKEERGSTAQFEHIYPPAEKRSGNNFPFPEEFEISTQNQRKSYSWKPSGDETQEGEGKLHWMTKNGRIYFKSLWGLLLGKMQISANSSFLKSISETVDSGHLGS